MTNLLKATLLVGILAFCSGIVNAQSKVVTFEAGAITKEVTIPSDFPVYSQSGDAAKDQSSFDAQLKTWQKTNPKFKNLNLTPSNFSGGSANTFIEIPTVDFNKYSIERQNAVKALPAFYHIKS